MATRVLLMADTHVDGRGSRAALARLVERLGDRLASADVILHAGDITSPHVLSALSGFAPVHAVLGNNDRGLDLPERVETTIDGVEVAMVHDSGPTKGRASRLRRWFPSADVVVFGHSHLPWNEVDVDGGHRQHHVNPGSPTQRRRAPFRTVAWLDLDDGRVAAVRHDNVG